MMSREPPKNMPARSAQPTRRRFLYVGTGAAWAVGGVAAAVPLVMHLTPDAATEAGRERVEVDLSTIGEGEFRRVVWKGKPVLVTHRTRQEVAETAPVPITGEHPQWSILIATCSYDSCLLESRADPGGRLICPCCASVYDWAGRMDRGPAPNNLSIPPHTFISDRKLRIG